MEELAPSLHGLAGNAPPLATPYGKHQEEEGDQPSRVEELDDVKAAVHTLLGRDLHHLTRPERSILYQEGVKLWSSGQQDSALKCLLGAITGLTEESSFDELPKCLHAVADIYSDKKEYEKAVYFIQAEKMYYETALIDIASVTDVPSDTRQGQADGDEDRSETPNEENGEEAKDDPDDDLSPDAKKGQEFENLARLCLREGKLQLALEYCGKATKLYQAVFGEDHPVTMAALDLFTVIYADVGKKLYSDAIQKFEDEEKVPEAEKSGDPESHDYQASSELRHRVNNNMKEVGSENGGGETMGAADTTHSGELEPTTGEEQDDWLMTVLLMLLFFLATVFIAIVISSIYCYNNSRVGYCAQTRGDINYWYMYARHVIHDVRKMFR